MIVISRTLVVGMRPIRRATARSRDVGDRIQPLLDSQTTHGRWEAIEATLMHHQSMACSFRVRGGLFRAEILTEAVHTELQCAVWGSAHQGAASYQYVQLAQGWVPSEK